MADTLSTAIATNGPIVSPFDVKGTTLAQDQAKAANQGKAGFDVLGNPTSFTTPSGATVDSAGNVKVQPTTLSGDKSGQIANNTQRTNDINAGYSQNKTAVMAGGLEKFADGTPRSAPSGAVQQTDENGNTWWTANGQNYAIGPDTSLSPEQQQSKDILDGLQAQSDAAFAGQIAATRQAYEQLISQQKQVNAGREAGNAQSLLESGSSRYEQEASNNNQANVVSKGISDIADLTSKENSAIAALNTAQMTHNYEIANKRLDEIDKIRTQKQKVMDDLQKNIQQGIKDAKDKIQKNNETADAAIRTVMLEAGKSGSLTADQNKALQTALANHDYAGAITAAGDSLQTATGTLGDYLQYKKDAQAGGLVPLDFVKWKDGQDAKAAKLKAQEAYSTGYNTESGKTAADAVTGGYNGTSAKQQVAMEKDFKNTLLKEFSTRSGTYGLNDAKVSQGNKLAVLFNQAYDPKTGNYNIAKSQYGELAIGLANMISGGTGASDTQISDLKQATAAGDWNKVYTYVTGSPSNASSQDVFKLLAQSVEREANQSIADRTVDEQKLIGLAPTDLDPARRDALIKAQSIPYTGIKGVAKLEVDNYLKQNGSQMIQMPDGQHSMYYYVSQLYKIPGATDENVQKYLKAKGLIQ